MPTQGQSVTYCGRAVTLVGPTAEDQSVWTGTDPNGATVYLSRDTIARLLGEMPAPSILNPTPEQVAVIRVEMENSPVMTEMTVQAEPAPTPAPRRPTCPCCRRVYTGELGVDHRCERISSVSCEHCKRADLELLREPPRGAFVCPACAGQGWFVCKLCGHDKQSGRMKGVCDHCNPLRETDIWARGTRAVGDEVTTQTRSHRPFAVEVESFLDPRHVSMERTRVSGWNEASDGSIVPDAGCTEEREFRSPPFKGDGGLDKLYIGVEAYRKMGFRANKSCGLHVHVDMADSSVEDRKALHQFGKWIEPEVFKLVARTRGDNHYCGKLMDFQHDESDKYKWLSVESYNRHRTVEIRLHHGCTQPDVVVEWAKVCLRIVEQGLKLGRMAQKPEGALFDLLNFNRYEKRFWLASARKLHGRNVEVL